MPKELTHWLLADRAFDGLPVNSRLKAAIAGNRSAYRFGAVLPDTLLHLYRGPYSPTALALSHIFHDSSGNSFVPLMAAESVYSDGLPPDALACFLGVIAHMEADIVFHPLVYALTGSAGIGRHYRIETDIDVCFLRNGTIPAPSHAADLLDPDTCETVIKACSLIFDPDGRLPREALEESIALHGRIQAMYDSTFWKLAALFLSAVWGAPFSDRRHLFYPLFPWSRSPFTPTEPIEWIHPVTGELQHCSLQELSDVTTHRIIRLFSQIEESGSLNAALVDHPAENMLTGLYGVTEKAVAH